MTPERHIRGEIQGLRAIAVSLVVLFHLWPDAVPGGYVGVDIFFVISGYLITGLLARMAQRDGHISLLDFYARRVRRLLPAATLVLMATTLGSLLFLPRSRWEETAHQIAASALYVENWVLAWLSVDYFGAEQTLSPVQHYWSLSIEEQFYVFWPLLMAGTIVIARRVEVPVRNAFAASLALVFGLSFAASEWSTVHDTARAYFLTHTRIWELALGGLMALGIHRFAAGPALRTVLVAVGLAAIAASTIVFSTQTDFPGHAALLPTVGAAFVIAGGDVRLGAFRGLNVRMLRYIGDRSYSIYLWHWPLVAFYTTRHEGIGLVAGVGLAALTLLISILSHRYVEERYRYSPAPREVRPLIYGLLSVAACLLASGAMLHTVSSRVELTLEPGDPRYPGPAALLSGAEAPADIPHHPGVAGLKKDLPLVYTNGCHQGQTKAAPLSCVLGDAESDRIAVVFGDSHAAQWIPALDIIAASQGWKLVSFTKSACAFARVEVKLSGKPYPSCPAWRENAVAAIKALHPLVVFTSQSHYPAEEKDMLKGLQSVWREFTSIGSRVVAIQDTPRMSFDPGDCLSSTPDSCVVAIDKARSNSTFQAAADGMEMVEVVDMTDGICGPTACDAVVGNMVVWRDRHHLTATYASALAPYLAQRLGLDVTDGEIRSRAGRM